MMNGNERFAAGKSDGLGRLDTDQKGADQPGTLSDGQGVGVGERGSGVAQARLYHGDEPLDVSPRSQFWHHTAKLRVNAHLRCDMARKHTAAILNKGNRGFVAGGF
jgi:hypothetical protein